MVAPLQNQLVYFTELVRIRLNITNIVLCHFGTKCHISPINFCLNTSAEYFAINSNK